MGKIKVITGDITLLEVDAIVNAANSSLLGGGGVDGAIHRAAGPALLEECKKWVALHGPCPTGQAAITSAGKLRARYVIHTVGPIWRGGTRGEAEALASCYRVALKLAEENECRSIAFPNISTGTYGFPKQEAAFLAVNAIRSVLETSPIEEVTLVCYDAENLQFVNRALQGGH